MKLGIMQPYFLPYIGYFSLIKHTNQFILFDTIQFIRHGWIERNRVLKQNGGWMYIQVPIIKQEGRDTIIKNVLINNTENWKNKIIAQLQHYKKKSPYYNAVMNIVADIFSKDYNDITTLNKECIQSICKYLSIDTQINIFSEMNLAIEEAHAPDEWALNICKAIGGVDEYWNPPGGKSFFNKTKYNNAGIDLKFQMIHLNEYNQKNSFFEQGLSILDVMMFNSPQEINEMLDNYEFI